MQLFLAERPFQSVLRSSSSGLDAITVQYLYIERGGACMQAWPVVFSAVAMCMYRAPR